jgi:hypothetical protein
MLVWIISAITVLVVVRIVYLEVLCGRRSRAFLARTNEDIASMTRLAKERYRAKFGRDPTETHKIPSAQEIAKAAGKKA